MPRANGAPEQVEPAAIRVRPGRRVEPYHEIANSRPIFLPRLNVNMVIFANVCGLSRDVAIVVLLFHQIHNLHKAFVDVALPCTLPQTPCEMLIEPDSSSAP